jgi:hypothetical protein
MRTEILFWKHLSVINLSQGQDALIQEVRDCTALVQAEEKRLVVRETHPLSLHSYPMTVLDVFLSG